MNIICVPSRGRHLFLGNNQKTFSYLKGTKHNVWIAVREEEEITYDFFNKEDYNIFTVLDCKNIAYKRQQVMEFAKVKGIEKVLFYDDDLQMYARNERFSSKYAIGNFPKVQIADEMSDQLFSICSEKYPMVGVATKQASFKLSKAFEYNKRIVQGFCLHVPTFFKEGLTFESDFVFMEDYKIQLELRSKGYILPTINSFCIGDSGRIDGGCQEYRNQDAHEDAALGLHALFPECTKIKKVKANTYWAHDRLDLSIDFKSLVDKSKLPKKQEMLDFMKANGYTKPYIMEEPK